MLTAHPRSLPHQWVLAYHLFPRLHLAGPGAHECHFSAAAPLFIIDIFIVVAINLLEPRLMWCLAKIIFLNWGPAAHTCLGAFFRFYVSGLMKGGSDLFVENLPGFPDSIRPSSSGGYWVSLPAIRANPGFSMLDFLSERPYIKRMIFKVTENYNSKNQNYN